MANDTSKLTINNTTYDIKDANARCSKYQYTLNKNNWSNNTYALSVSASNIDCKCYNTIELSNYYDINQWKTYGISIESTEKNYDSTTDTTTLATIYFKCETVPESNLTFAIASFPSKTSIDGDLVNPYNDNDYTNADKALVQDSPITVSATGSDLTLSTSSGSLNALTVYGKSEVVDGAIKSAGDSGSIKVRTESKNSLNITATTQTINGITFTINPDKTVTVNGTATATARLNLAEYRLMGRTARYLSGTPVAGSVDTIRLGYQGYGFINTANAASRLDRTDSDTDWDNYVFIEVAEGYTANNLLFKPMISYSNDITYEPYIGNITATFSTGTPLLATADGTIRDIMQWNGTSGKVTKKFDTLDISSVYWGYSGHANKFFYRNVDGCKSNSQCLSNKYTPLPPCSAHDFSQNAPDKSIANADTNNQIYIRDDDYTDQQDFRNANVGTIVQYQLVTPIIQPLTSTENASLIGLKTFTPSTHISNNASTDMSVEAYANTSNGKAITEIADKIDVLSSDKETKSVELSYADYVALPTKDPETSYYVPDAPDTWIFGYDLDKDDENPFTRVSYPADVDNTFYTPAFMDFTNDVFNYGSWEFKPGEKFMPNPCMLLYNGTVGYYLNPNDNTKKADGTASDVADTSYGGNAMMEWELLYTKRWEENGVYKFRVSNVRIDADWECWCNYDINNNVIPHFYTPIYFGSYDGTRMRSLSGQSNMVSTTAQQEIDRAKANGSDIWYTEVTSDQKLIEDLAILMCKSTAIQEKYGTGRISASSAIAPGTMNTKGMFWGDNGGTNGVKIFGMENPYGNIWRRQAGYTYNVGVQKIKLTRGIHDGSTATDYNTTGSGYISIPNSIVTGSSGGYITEMITTPFGRFPKALGGSQTTFEADACWHNDTYNGCYALVGGYWVDGRRCGLFYVYLNAAPSLANSCIGASLSCKPLAV